MFQSKVRKLQIIGCVLVLLLVALSGLNCLKIRHFVKETIIVDTENSSTSTDQVPTERFAANSVPPIVSLEPGQEVQEIYRETEPEFRNNSFRVMLIAGVLQCLAILAVRFKLSIILSVFSLLVTIRTWLACIVDTVLAMGGLGYIDASLTPIGYIVCLLAIANLVFSITASVLYKRYRIAYPIDPVQQQQSIEQAMTYMIHPR